MNMTSISTEIMFNVAKSGKRRDLLYHWQGLIFSILHYFPFYRFDFFFAFFFNPLNFLLDFFNLQFITKLSNMMAYFETLLLFLMSDFEFV